MHNFVFPLIYDKKFGSEHKGMLKNKYLLFVNLWLFNDAFLTAEIFMFYENDQQDSLYRLTYYSKSVLHVSGDVFTHHLEHLTEFTVSVSFHPRCCRLVSWMS